METADRKIGIHWMVKIKNKIYMKKKVLTECVMPVLSIYVGEIMEHETEKCLSSHGMDNIEG